MELPLHILYHISPAYSFVKQGVFYFRRRVPSDLRRHYKSPQIAFSLRTKSASVAASRASRAALKLDEYWYHLRSADADIPGKHLLRRPVAAGSVASALNPVVDDAVSIPLSEAVHIYLRLKGVNRPVTFHRAAERSCGYVIDICGDKDLSHYTKADANAFRDALINRGLAGSSITRIFGTVRSVINFAAAEAGVDLRNPFGGVYYDRTAGVKDRSPMSVEEIMRIQSDCREINDDLRWLVAIVSDTGMRLAEAAGLHRDDIILDAETPKVVIEEHPWRRLKTSGSAREIPLVGASLWAAQQLLSDPTDHWAAFPRYNRHPKTNANSASAALNKWIKTRTREECTMHSFRHSLRDRLRAVECPADIVDQIGGWRTDGVGQSYGSGYPLEVLSKWMKEVA